MVTLPVIHRADGATESGNGENKARCALRLRTISTIISLNLLNEDKLFFFFCKNEERQDVLLVGLIELMLDR